MSAGPLIPHHHTTAAPSSPSGTPVPAEIWAKIIHWAIGGPGAYLDRTRRRDFLRLRHVSRLWRTTAFSTPYLWRRLAIDSVDRESPQARLRLKKVVPRWFEQGGRGAEVHLRIGGLRAQEGRSVDWIDVIWPLDAQQYRLVTVLLWGDLILRLDSIPHDQPCTSSLRNLSLDFGRHSPFHMNIAFPGLESLVLCGLYFFPVFTPIYHHPSLRSLLISDFTIQPLDFVRLFQALPMLEELVLYEDQFTENSSDGDNPTLMMTNTSIRTLICNPCVLATWPNGIILSSIKVLKIIPCRDETYRYPPDSGDNYIPSHDDNLDLSRAAGTVSRWSPRGLAVDLMSLEVESRGVIPFLSHIPPIQALIMKTLAPLLSADPEGREWRENPNVKVIICQQRSLVPPSFVVTPCQAEEHLLPSNSKSPCIFIPRNYGEGEDSYHLCQESAAASVSFNLTRLARGKLDALPGGNVPILNHGYERIVENILC
jgi:F-box-like